MHTIGSIIEFASPRFPRHPRDSELANSDSMHGFALAQFIGEGLNDHRFKIARYVAEDWGWYCEVENDGFELMYGVCNFNDAEFLIQFSPSQAIIRRWFKKIDVSATVSALQSAVFEILSSDDQRTMGPEWRR